MKESPRIALVIPVYNEEVTIEKVIDDFAKVNLNLEIFIINNNSTDRTVEIAKKKLESISNKGEIFHISRQGKANAIRHAFRNIEADIYVMIDGDDTYCANDIYNLIQPILDSAADMVVGDRMSFGKYNCENKRPFHSLGNNLVCRLINTLYKTSLNDIMSGYRVMTREFVKNYPILHEGFELETDITLHALDKRYQIIEVPIDYKERVNSKSKLNTFQDGWRVMVTIFKVFKDYKPLLFFSVLSLIFFLLGLALGGPVILEFIQTRYIKHVPLAILASGLMIISILILSIGITLDTIVRNHRFIYEQNCLKNN